MTSTFCFERFALGYISEPTILYDRCIAGLWRGVVGSFRGNSIIYCRLSAGGGCVEITVLYEYLYTYSRTIEMLDLKGQSHDILKSL